MNLRRFLQLLSFVLILTCHAQTPSDNDLYGLLNDQLENESRHLYSRDAISEEYYITGFKKITVKEEDRRRSFSALASKAAQPIFMSEVTDSVVFYYKKNRLDKKQEYRISHQYYYSEDTLHFIERENIRDNQTNLYNQYLYSRGMSDQYITNLITTKNRLAPNSRMTSFIKRYKTANETVFETVNTFENGAKRGHTFTRSFKNILGDKRISSETVQFIDGSFRTKNEYEYQMVDGLLVQTVVDSQNDKYALRTKYDNQGRVVEKGIYERKLYSGELKFLILNKVTYNSGEIIISEYQDTFYNEASMSKNIHKQFILKKNGFSNAINYIHGLVDVGDLNSKLFLTSDISGKLMENNLLVEKTFKNGKELNSINYHYIMQGDWVRQIEGILYYPNVEQPHGLVYFYERIFE